jgi:uncharacterized protein YjbJ (UPF0337 family)
MIRLADPLIGGAVSVVQVFVSKKFFRSYGTDARSWRYFAGRHHQPKETTMVNRDQIEGVAKQAKGAVKDAAGKITGSTSTQAEGKAEKVAGKVQKAYGDAKEKVKDNMK